MPVRLANAVVTNLVHKSYAVNEFEQVGGLIAPRAADGGGIAAIWRDRIQCGDKWRTGCNAAVFDIRPVDANILTKAAGVKAKALRAAIGHFAVRIPALGCKACEPSACQE